jgi:heme-degrading monooxygenase HmoA
MSEPFTGPDARTAEPVTLINLFTVPPGESEAFLHHWRRSARIMAAQPGFVRARLHRALDEDVELRFVNVAEWASGTAFDRARTDREFLAESRRVLDEPQLHISGRPAPYRVALDVHTGDPRPDDRPVTLINPFTVLPAEAERFLQVFRDSSRIMAAQAGAFGGHLYRALDDAVEFGFVDVARWADRTAFERASADPEWRASTQCWLDDPRLHVTARPALYELAVEVHPGDEP